MDPVEGLLQNRRSPVAIVAARISLPEILTTSLLTHCPLPEGIVSLIEQAVRTFPRSPIDGPSGVAADHAGALLLEHVGLQALAECVDTEHELRSPPSAWPEMLTWAAMSSALAIPGLSTDVTGELAGRESDIVRAACLAAMQRRMLACSRVLRWLVAGHHEHTPPDVVEQLCSYLLVWSDEEPRLAYELCVIKARQS